MKKSGAFSKARRQFHAALLKSVLSADASGVPANADRHSQGSVKIAQNIREQIGKSAKEAERLAGQESGAKFEGLVCDFISATFTRLPHLRPGDWQIERVAGAGGIHIAKFDQYSHLIALQKAAEKDRELAAALGSDYTITPDIIVARNPEPDEMINHGEHLLDDDVSILAPLRKVNQGLPILHASISCKWTIRSDRAQNSRTEALNLIKNRKGSLPHVVVVTGEPLPGRIASIALGTGEIDCVYHFALRELRNAVETLAMSDAIDLLETMVQGKRLRDIADLPLDLAV